MLARTALALCLAATFACGDDDMADLPDQGTPDSSTPDSGTPDSGPADSGPADSGAEADSGSDDAGQGDMTTPSDRLTVLCEAQVARSMECFGDSASVAECRMDNACSIELLRPDLIDGIAACLRDCDAGEDGCYVPENIGATTSAAVVRYTEACATRRSECEDIFSDDLCFAGPVTDAAAADFETCLTEPCADIQTCLFGFLDCE